MNDHAAAIVAIIVAAATLLGQMGSMYVSLKVSRDLAVTINALKDYMHAEYVPRKECELHGTEVERRLGKLEEESA